MKQNCYLIQKSGVKSLMALITKKSLDEYGPDDKVNVTIILMHTGEISAEKPTKNQILEAAEMIKEMTPATAQDFFYTACSHIDNEAVGRKKAMAKALGLKLL